MTARLRTGIALRLVFAAIWLLSMIYGVIAYVPFTYAQVIEGKLSEGLLAFAAQHFVFAWIATGALTFVLWDRLRRFERGAGALLVAVLAAAAIVTLSPILGPLRNEPRSLWIGLAMTLPIFGLAAVDWADGRRRIEWLDTERIFAADSRLWWSCLIAALTVWTASAAIAVMRGGTASLPAEFIWSLPAHLTLFGGVFVVAMFGAGVARIIRRPAQAEFAVAGLIVWVTLDLLITQVILRPMAFVGGLAWLSAGIAAAAVVALWMSMALQIRTAAGTPAERGFDVLFNPSGRSRPAWVLGIWLAVLGAGAVLATNRVANLDWNFLGQEVIAAVLGLIALSISYGAIRPAHVGAGSGIALACVAPVAFAIVVSHADRALADRAVTVNPSYRLLDNALIPEIESAAATDGLYEFMIANTNLPREQKVDPLDVRLVENLSKTNAPLPHIFIVVIDSLRRDYVAPFNPAVNFTPRLAAFAAEGVAFTNAFTRYGATGLSEPSIWVGGMMLHKQYVEPFAPQNSLAKLLTAEEYTPFVSVDSILKVSLPSEMPRLVELDRGRATKDYRLCGSLSELQAQITSGNAPRMFSYTQAEDIHISTIARDNKSVPGGGDYPGFYAPYAARIAGMDACFGTFIDALKTSGLYDNSIVIFTADHGDSLGEEGRWGHAYTVFPEVMRIPLIIKMPGDQSRIAANKDALVFSTDITPTLYDLLGHPPSLSGFPFGRSLAAGPLPRTDGELLGSSYGAVYGWLTQNGQRLYIADSVNFQDYAYDISNSPVGTRSTAASAERTASRQAIRNAITAIAKTYHFAVR